MSRTEQSNLRWAVEWSVKREGQWRTAEILRVNRTTSPINGRRSQLVPSEAAHVYLSSWRR